MSVGYNPKNELTADQELKVQELVVSSQDNGLYHSASGNTFVYVREPIDKIFLARVKVDASNTWVEFAQSSLSIVDSVSLTNTPPSDKGAIEIAGLSSLASNDVIIVKYSVLEHL